MRLVIADPSLFDEAGHPLNYACALREHGLRRGHRVAVVGSRFVDATLAERYEIRPGFTFGYSGQDARVFKSPHVPGPWRGLRAVSRRLASVLVPHRDVRRGLRVAIDHEIVVRRTVRDWNAVDVATRLSADDLVVVNSVDTRALEALVRWLHRRDPVTRPLVVAVLHYQPEQDPEAIASAAHRWTRTFRRVAEFGLCSALRLAVDSAQLRSAYAALGAETTVVPIPHTPARTMQPPLGRTTGPGPRTVLFIGVATKTKGFHFLPDVVRRCEEAIATGRLRFEIQVNIVDPAPEVTAAAEALSHLPVTLVSGPMTPSAYYETMARADILLQPHDPDHYAAQTSGIFTEARAMGLVTIVPAGTWMAAHLAEKGGGMCVGTWSPAAYADALAACLADLPGLQQQAAAEAAAWVRDNSPEGFALALNRVLPPSHRL